MTSLPSSTARPVCTRSCSASARRILFWMSSNGQLDGWLGDLIGEHPLVGGGGSVATSALNLALRWGCDPIAVVGLDLSFAGGKYYVDTSCDGGAAWCCRTTAAQSRSRAGATSSTA